jgi:type IV pilus assembly protein PilC
VNYTALAVALLLGCIGALYGGLKTAPGRRAADFVFLHIPTIGSIVREVNAARTARTLASLSTAGVDILTALGITREVVQNTYFQEVIAVAEAGVRQGQPLSVIFIKNEHLYPAFVGEMMAVGEETGQTAEMLKRLAVYYEDEVDRKTKDMSAIIEPFLMVFIGAAVGFFAVSMITPIYQISENI